MKIMIADDHQIVREGLKQLLNGQQDMEVVGEAQDGRETIVKAKSLRPDVLLLDVTMPRLNGLEAIGLIKEAVPDVRIVVFSMHKKEAYARQALAAGALGYVLKASPSSEILAAIRAVYSREYFLSREINAEIIDAYLENRKTSSPVHRYDLLSEREQQVFRLIVEGNSTKEIADILCISPKTVEKHRSNFMKKLGVNDLVGMVKYAIKINIIDPEHWE
ncbi:MAG: response regulator transcription factor [Desulfobacteraceae bacterium]|nr:response regulator transcription factor [Desulfobacteraceae bacterium]